MTIPYIMPLEMRMLGWRSARLAEVSTGLTKPHREMVTILEVAIGHKLSDPAQQGVDFVQGNMRVIITVGDLVSLSPGFESVHQLLAPQNIKAFIEPISLLYSLSGYELVLATRYSMSRYTKEEVYMYSNTAEDIVGVAILLSGEAGLASYFSPTKY
jgi:hypothetical protein